MVLYINDTSNPRDAQRQKAVNSLISNVSSGYNEGRDRRRLSDDLKKLKIEEDVQSPQARQLLLNQAGQQRREQNVGQRQQQALQSFQQSLTGDESPQEIAMKFAQHTAGIPGAEQLANSILPFFERESENNLYKKATQGKTQVNQKQNNPNQTGIVGETQQNTSYPGIGNIGQQPGVNAPQRNNSVPNNAQNPPQNNEEIEPLSAEDLATAKRLNMSPQAYLGLKYNIPEKQVQADAESLTQRQYETEYNTAETYLGGPKKVTPEEVNKFLRFQEKYPNLKGKEKLHQANKDYQAYITARDNIKNLTIPGTVKNLLGSVGELFGPNRKTAVKDAHEAVKPLLQRGEYSEALSLLENDQEGYPNLSSTESRSIVYPVSEEIIKKMSSLPDVKGPKSKFKLPLVGLIPGMSESPNRNEKINKEIPSKISNFIKKNITPETSLLALRNEMMENKGYNWQEFYQGYIKAVDDGYVVSPSQQGELVQLNQPPLNSLSSIFRDWGNIYHFLEGKQ